MYACVCIYTYIHIHVYICVYIYIYVCGCVCMCVRVCRRMYTYDTYCTAHIIRVHECTHYRRCNNKLLRLNISWHKQTWSFHQAESLAGPASARSEQPRPAFSGRHPPLLRFDSSAAIHQFPSTVHTLILCCLSIQTSLSQFMFVHVDVL